MSSREDMVVMWLLGWLAERVWHFSAWHQFCQLPILYLRSSFLYNSLGRAGDQLIQKGIKWEKTCTCNVWKHIHSFPLCHSVPPHQFSLHRITPMRCLRKHIPIQILVLAGVKIGLSKSVLTISCLFSVYISTYLFCGFPSSLSSLWGWQLLYCVCVWVCLVSWAHWRQ